jgi:hypothetical protein
VIEASELAQRLNTLIEDPHMRAVVQAIMAGPRIVYQPFAEHVIDHPQLTCSELVPAGSGAVVVGPLGLLNALIDPGSGVLAANVDTDHGVITHFDVIR